MLKYLVIGAAMTCAASLAFAECRDEVGYVASFKVKAGSEAAFEAAIVNVAAVVLANEPDVLLYAPFRAADGTYYMMERYPSLEARNVHGSSAEVQAAFPSIGPHIDGRPTIVPVERVCAE